MKKFLYSVVAVAACALAGAAGAQYVIHKSASGVGTTTVLHPDGSTTAQPTVYRTVNVSADNYPDFTYAAERCIDAVVYVKVTAIQQGYSPNNMLEYFFGFGSPSQREAVGSGSGVIIRQDGYIVTNNHVIAGANKIEVTLNDNKTYSATLLGTDPATDVALIKIEATGLPFIELGDSDALRLGEWVLAIGSPYDLRQTITAGIVSAKGRSMPNNTGEFKIESFIQTDAAVNPGNSGGALVDKAGRLVGINTAIISQTGSYSGYSFAVPVNIVKRIVNDLIDFGSVRRALLGISMQNIDAKKAAELKISSPNGVYIAEVAKGSAAEAAGVKAGDVLIAIDGKNVTDGASVQEMVTRYHPGDKARLTVVRDGKNKELNVEFKGTVQENGTRDDDGSVAYFGSKIRSASKELLDAYNLKGGVEVVSVGEGKLAQQGVPEGFIILYVNNQPVSKPEDVLEQTKKAKRTVLLEGVNRNGRVSYYGFGL
ncbi:MAG: Do family serine endopeptidase [Bacteroidales bacterium]|nr:Do family serine endopeptidase [Bacteroidales bacterium]